MNKLLILDLDETVIHSTQEWIGHLPTFESERLGFVFVRPGLQAFLQSVRCEFSLAVWSAATESYVDAVTQMIFSDLPLLFAWSRTHCDAGSHANDAVLRKDLGRVRDFGFDLSRVLVVDDRPELFARHPDNLVAIRPFYGGNDDCELIHLASYLEQFLHCEDVRLIDKTSWRETVSRV